MIPETHRPDQVRYSDACVRPGTGLVDGLFKRKEPNLVTENGRHPEAVRQCLQQEALTYIDSLYRTAVRMTRNPSDAEDLVQETYLRALRSLDRFKPGTNLRAWLFKIMTNAFINEYRKRTRQPRNQSLDNVEEYYVYAHLIDSGVQPESRGPEEEVLASLTDDNVVAALESLSDEFRQVVLLADVEGFAYREIADILDIPIGTVMSLLHRSRRRLQRMLTGSLVEAQPYGDSAHE
jgi:RNA polymerase sigma-70 factor (ECF subfamily)